MLRVLFAWSLLSLGCLTLAGAQGVGIYQRADCTTLTGAVAGATVCFDTTHYVWRTWNGASWIGGVPLAAPAVGQIPVGTGTTYVPSTLTAGANISITNGPGTVTIAGTTTLPSPAQLISTKVVSPPIGTLTGPPPATSPYSLVQLVSAGGITDQSGNTYAVTQPLTLDITTTGAGGTQSAVTTGTWYQCYWISNASGSTQALFAVNQPLESVVRNPSAIGGAVAALGNTYEMIGTPYVPSSNQTVSSLVFNTTASSAITAGWVWIEIRNDGGGVPGSTIYGTSRIIDRQALIKAGGATTSATYWPFATPVSLTSGTTYWLVLRTDNLAPAGDNVLFDYETATTYNSYGWNGTSWVLFLSHQLYFTVNTWPPPTALVLPSGYTQYALVTWFMTVGSSPITVRQFHAENRHVTTIAPTAGLWTIKDVPGSTTTTTWYTNTLFPPTPIAASFSLTPDSSATTGAQGIIASSWWDVGQTKNTAWCYLNAVSGVSNLFVPCTTSVFLDRPGVNAVGLGNAAMYLQLTGFDW